MTQLYNSSNKYRKQT